jgi:hypothetical protein
MENLVISGNYGNRKWFEGEFEFEGDNYFVDGFVDGGFSYTYRALKVFNEDNGKWCEVYKDDVKQFIEDSVGQILNN